MRAGSSGFHRLTGVLPPDVPDPRGRNADGTRAEGQHAQACMLSPVIAAFGALPCSGPSARNLRGGPGPGGPPEALCLQSGPACAVFLAAAPITPPLATQVQRARGCFRAGGSGRDASGRALPGRCRCRSLGSPARGTPCSWWRAAKAWRCPRPPAHHREARPPPAGAQPGTHDVRQDTLMKTIFGIFAVAAALRGLPAPATAGIRVIVLGTGPGLAVNANGEACLFDAGAAWRTGWPKPGRGRSGRSPTDAGPGALPAASAPRPHARRSGDCRDRLAAELWLKLGDAA